jgi:hypothetical protein
LQQVLKMAFPSIANAAGSVWVFAALCAALLIAAGRAQAAGPHIYRCEYPDRPVLYSQFVCPPDGSATHFIPGEHSIVRIPALSAEETMALAALERNLRSARAQHQRSQRRQQQQLQQSLQQAAELCRDARSGLDDLRARKRNGYSAAEARQLDKQQQRLQAQKKANC